MMRRALLMLALLGLPGLAPAVPVDDYPYLRAMVDRLAAEGLDRRELVRTFEQATLRPEVVKAMKRPAERLPWHRYRSFFITPPQIANGIEFWRRHEDTLARAAAESGVPAQIIVAVIGVETRYGTTLGSHPVLDSLTTLTLQYPRRREFFGKQLEHFLLLAHEHALDPLAVRGSYAGAIGIPQFMPSSYREYAVDFSGDGRADLVNQTEDAIGSVANYLSRFEWRRGAPVATPARPEGVVSEDRDSSRKPDTTVAALRDQGLVIDSAVDGGAPAGVIRLEARDGMRHWVAFENFYVLMRYNPSYLYAMAVSELSDRIRAQYDGS